ncbi:hypothetical protein BCR44DRAFT_1225489 [Catenaria anguillulae PL171]|uniref:HCNGP-like protein-domain-containing protein n=1 Tax=Catenaria anguillulae PL171 TaxID=765915 RepID=A0A1Y2HFQ8_9FUNG|nr:hypothetical protein BCR44DRAFT_1225489 [Catenaria anguillulae PL171]
MDVDDDDQAPILGPQRPSPQHSPKQSPPAVPVLPPFQLDTSSWIIPVVSNVTDMYSYSDFIAHFMHGRQMTSQQESIVESPTRRSSHDSHSSPRKSAPPSALSTLPSSSFASAAASCQLFSSFTPSPIAIPPPAPASKIDPALLDKLKQWTHLKHTTGQHFTDAVLRAPNAGNPAVLHKMVAMFGIDEYGSQFSPLHPWERQSADDGGRGREKLKRGEFLTELAKRQAQVAARAQQQRQSDTASGVRPTISFVRGRTGDQPSDRW